MSPTLSQEHQGSGVVDAVDFGNLEVGETAFFLRKCTGRLGNGAGRLGNGAARGDWVTARGGAGPSGAPVPLTLVEARVSLCT